MNQSASSVSSADEKSNTQLNSHLSIKLALRATFGKPAPSNTQEQ